MESKPLNRLAFVTLLLMVSILSLTPALAHADQQASVTVVINATGEATPTNSGGNQLASLTLSGSGYINSNKWVIIDNLAGSLKIGSTNYTITAGHGSVNTYGEIAIFADTNSGQLILYGTENGDGVTFDVPSQLTSVASLSLNGSLNQMNGSASPASPVSNSTDAASANETPSSANITQSGNTTQGPTSITANSTHSVTLNTTSATNSSVVTTTTVSNTSATTPYSSTTYSTSTDSSTLSSSTINSTTMSSTTLTGSSNVPLNPPTQGNVTVTVTQYVSQTTSATQTVANVTISYTVTTTVANTTVTVGNVTSTVTSTTGT